MKQGEIWRINLDPAVGGEMKKSRPALIINIDGLGKLPLRVIVPITDWKERYSQYPWMVKIESDNQNKRLEENVVNRLLSNQVGIG